MNPPITIGIIGIGHIAEHQINALKSLAQYKISAVCDLKEDRKDFFDLSVPFYSDYKEMMMNENLDTVLISTPNTTHYEICKFALNKNVTPLVEKPATHQRHLLSELIQLSKDKQALLSVAYHARFANDVLWFKENLPDFEEEWGPITGFQCQFYDPYIQNGKLVQHAENLQGSWIDSGINALSVIDSFIPINHLQMKEARLSHIDGFNCSEIQGTVDYTFPIKGKGNIGRGQIDTNWTLGLNNKQTTLYFDHSNQTVILQHSKEQILQMQDPNKHDVLKDFSNDRPRLENHYINLFKDYYDVFTNKRDRSENNMLLHDRLFETTRD